MTFRRRFILLFLAGSIAFGLVGFLSKPAEPSYKGRSLKEWMDIYMWPDNPTVGDLFPRKIYFEERDARQEEAADAVRNIGTNAVPALLEWEDKDSRVAWKVKLHAALPKVVRGWQPVEWWLIEEDQFRVTRALIAFYILGSNGLAAVPELSHRMTTRNSDSGVKAGLALGNMGRVGLPALIAALTNTQSPNRVMLARSVASATKIASNDLSGIVALAQCVLDANTGVGTEAAMELGFITNQTGVAVPALVEGLKQPGGQVRARCAAALANYGWQARSAIPVLLQYQNDSDWFVRQSVSNALENLAPAK